MSRRRKILCAIVVLLGVAVLIPYLHHRRLRAAVNRYVAELKAKGELLELTQAVPPPVLREQNSAAIFQQAVSSLNTNKDVLESNPPPAMRMVAPGKAMIGWAQPKIQNTEGTNSWEDIEAALASEAGVLQSLRQIIDRPAFDFQLNYEKGFTLLLPHLAPMKKCAKRLSAAAISDLHREDTASAATNVLAMLALVKSSRDEPIIISQLVRIAIAHLAWSANWELLQSRKATEAQLAELQRGWSDLEFIRAQENAFLFERATSQMTIAGSRKVTTPYRDLGILTTNASPWLVTKIWAKEYVWRFWWSYSDELRSLKIFQAIIDASRTVKTNHSFLAALKQKQSDLANLRFSKTNDNGGHVIDVDVSEMDFHWIFSEGALACEHSLKKFMFAEVAKQIAITAIALKRYQLRHGSYPSNLTELIPEFMSEIPRDPADGEPLRYRPVADGTFLLYSIGEDGKDDGGDPNPPDASKSRAWQFGRDWVWPQPATAEEIKAAEESRPSPPATAERPSMSKEERRLFEEGYGLRPKEGGGTTNKTK